MATARTIEISLTAEELAEQFADLGSDDQARFFAKVWRIAKAWPGTGWCQQACAIVEQLDDDGREMIAALAEHIALARESSK